MEAVEAVVIVGGGVAGLATALGLHRLGIRSLVLESSDDLRTSGYALITFTNGWKALDALGIGDVLRKHHIRLERNFLLESLAKELPTGTIRFSSKVVHIEESGFFKLVHLADGTILKAKVLVGCNGVNSVVANWLGFNKPAFAGRFAIRGCVDFKRDHGFEPKFMQFFGKGVRSGVIPLDAHTVYWFVTCTPSSKEEELEQDPAKIKQLVLSKLGKVPDKARALIENYELDAFRSLPMRYRPPWELPWGNISKSNVCVADDALHPSTPEMGQGESAALEDAVVLARFLADVLLKKPTGKTKENGEEEKDEYDKIVVALKKYAKERVRRSIEVISLSYVAGFIQESRGNVMNFLRDKALVGILAGFLLKLADFDCGKLIVS